MAYSYYDCEWMTYQMALSLANTLMIMIMIKKSKISKQLGHTDFFWMRDLLEWATEENWGRRRETQRYFILTDVKSQIRTFRSLIFHAPT
jgi:hypothetical protein